MQPKTDEDFSFETMLTKPAGLPPGTLFIPPGAQKPIMELVVYDEHQGERHRLKNTEGILPYLDKGRKLWLDVNGLGDAAIIESVGEIFGLHRLSLEDVTNLAQRPKIEDYGTYLYAVVQFPVFDDGMDFEQISVFIGPDYVLTFEATRSRRLEAVYNRIKTGRGLITRSGSDYLGYSVLDVVIDAYFPFLEKFDLELEKIEGRMLAGERLDPVKSILHLKHRLVEIRRAMWGARDALNSLIRDGHRLIETNTKPYLRDTHDHTLRILEITETMREQCSSLMDFHYANLSQRLNEVMKVLTIITTIFIPLSFIAAIYGMNFNPEASPYNMPELNARFAYPITLGFMTVIGGIMLYFFKRKGWLGKHSTS